MILYAHIDSEGYPLRAGSAHALPPGAIEVTIDPEQLVRMRLAEGAWVIRPDVPRPLIAHGPAGCMVVLSDLPEGVRITVTDFATGECLADDPPVVGGIDLLLADAGVYQIEADAPRPWRGWTIEVTV